MYKFFLHVVVGIIFYGVNSVAWALCEPEKDPSVISAQAAYDKANAEHVQERQRMHDVYSSSQLKPTAKEKARERQLDSDEHKAAKALEKAYAQVRPCMALSTFDSSGREVPVRPACGMRLTGTRMYFRSQSSRVWRQVKQWRCRHNVNSANVINAAVKSTCV